MSIISNSRKYQEKKNSALNVFSREYKQSGENLNDRNDDDDKKLAVKINTDTYIYAANLNFRNVKDQSLINKSLQKSTGYKEILGLSLEPEFYKTKDYKSFLSKCEYLENLDFNLKTEDDYIFIEDIQKSCLYLKNLTLNISDKYFSEFHKLDFSLPQVKNINFVMKTKITMSVFNFSQFPNVESIEIKNHYSTMGNKTLAFAGVFPTIPFSLTDNAAILEINEDTYPYLKFVRSIKALSLRSNNIKKPILRYLSSLHITTYVFPPTLLSEDYMPFLETLDLRLVNSIDREYRKIKLSDYFESLTIEFIENISEITDIFEMPKNVDVTIHNNIDVLPKLNIDEVPVNTFRNIYLISGESLNIIHNIGCTIITNVENISIECELTDIVQINAQSDIIVNCLKQDFKKLVFDNPILDVLEIATSNGRAMYYLNKSYGTVFTNETVKKIHSNIPMKSIIFKNCKIDCDVLENNMINRYKFINCIFGKPLHLTKNTKNLKIIAIYGDPANVLKIDEMPNSLKTIFILLDNNSRHDLRNIPINPKIKFSLVYPNSRGINNYKYSEEDDSSDDSDNHSSKDSDDH